ncbi:retrovirus-like pol polyprotein [Lasius niger]|uniref:Retrovirus-like pol polyprotein n=1 Tax=Lasius niger TaxID=67767 RepID=A0A0J7K1U7_LASNI|nr:retrovirus-like pol polyprotein [Lasius niger]
MGPFPASRNGFAYLLIIQDLFTKWIECCPLRKANGKKIREAIAELVINRWGTPRVLLTDNGTEFVNRDLKALAEEFGIARVTVPQYHPQANPVERVNRVIKTMVIAFLEHDHRDWDIHLAEFRFAYNTAFHTSLQATPAFLNLGREPNPANARQEGPEPELEVDDTAKWKERMERIQALRDWVIENLDAAHQRQAHYYNQHRRDRHFVIGDQVLKRQHVLSSAAHAVSAKLATKYHGPFTVTKVLSPVVYEFTDSEGKAIGKIHVKDLKPYVACSQL